MLPSSTNPTLPYGINTQAELFDMIMVCHNLNPKMPSDVAFAESRVRAETIAAENVLHDMGVISMISSDSQAMGRVGENFLRAIQTADAMKKARGPLPEDASGNDNFRVLRYVAKVTINPAITLGISHVLGSIDPGQDGRPRALGAGILRRQAEAGHQGRLINWAIMGDPNASLPTPQPMYYRPMFGAFGSALARDLRHASCRGRRYDARHRRALRAAKRQVMPVTARAPSPSATWCATARRPRSRSTRRPSR